MYKRLPTESIRGKGGFLTTLSLGSDHELLRQLVRPVHDDVHRGSGDPELLDLPVRWANSLKNCRINFVFQLIRKSESELLKTKNFGPKGVNELKMELAAVGLSLGMRIEPDVLERLERFAEGKIKAPFVFSDMVMPNLSSLTEAVELVAGRQELVELLAWPGAQLILERPDLARTVLENLELLRFATALQKLGQF